MNKFDNFAVDLFNKIRGRFPNVSIGDENGKVTNIPKEARFFDFGYKIENIDLGKVSVALDEENGVTIIVGKDIVEGQVESIQDNWYNFLKELRIFAKKRMLKFDVRDINKSNLNKRDYEYLAQNRPGENTMSESRMYGNETRSYQKIGKARIAIKHSAPINLENANSRTSKIGSIYIESPTGERFKYPYKHLAGARAMALHVNEGGHMYDDFGKHISGLSEEMSKLRKFSQYMNRSTVMAETLEGYTDIVKGRIKEVRQEIQNLQKLGYYKEASENFELAVMEDVPTDIADSWVDQLTIKQFNEELKDVFPYIYNLVGEAVKPTEIGLEDIVAEAKAGYCSDDCCGADVKAEDCTCKPSCSHCDCNATNEGFFVNDIDSLIEKAVDKLMGQFAEEKSKGSFEPHPGAFDWDANMDDDEDDDDEKESYSPGDENEEGMVSNCCGAPVMDVYQGHGRCSDCKEMASAVPESDDDTMDVKIGPQGMEPMDKEPEKEKTPIGEFILSYFDRENGSFPKGETAVLTMVEKEYGEQYVEPAAKFIKKVESMIMARQAAEQANTRYPETDRIKSLAGLN